MRTPMLHRCFEEEVVGDAKMRGQAVGKNTTRCNVGFYDRQNKGVVIGFLE
jgi:hypothetical protein